MERFARQIRYKAAAASLIQHAECMFPSQNCKLRRLCLCVCVVHRCLNMIKFVWLVGPDTNCKLHNHK
ncbi:hypothetical protein Ciccas_008131 [Cichlidogyrus casuarinus]|uniref:Uncharacterized protein n=1 Tax=Cichlidogyrus casuarinus TaxID=1844966 RepID=A0ABD2Q230_9PLAT